jgi:uncharacterized protein YndB with AHSA1/START domain
MFRTVMRSPEGKDYPNLGCYLEIVPERRLVWTEALLPGFRPAPENTDASCGGLVMTGAILLEPRGTGTRYTAVALHRDPETRRKHEEMGFHEGWGRALDQLLDVVRGM